MNSKRIFYKNTACAEPLAKVEADVDPAFKKVILSVGIKKGYTPYGYSL
ncbi:hypothetical protein KL86SPO_31660 [uncultured Sporomusa sp.]|uniref:Uncharacterized protein n=1 Tax=uncultured Sporomusa sp. TaxID=307249 RepID=A0A212LVE5_9FIRM|nr:hypothetical protein KL86SPO_31660 [uncultured Sporomusa sp.]